MDERPGEKDQLRLAAAEWEHPAAAGLREDQQSELRALYGADTEPGVKPSSSDVQVFLLAWAGGADGEPQAIGCGGLRPLDEHTAEIKRMYVRPTARGRGVSRRILAALEAAAAEAGWHRLRLETGPLQREAIALYESAGYRRIPNFGHYRTSTTSLCYEKVLRSASGSDRGPGIGD